jgi:hypothetical protein
LRVELLLEAAACGLQKTYNGPAGLALAEQPRQVLSAVDAEERGELAERAVALRLVAERLAQRLQRLSQTAAERRPRALASAAPLLAAAAHRAAMLGRRALERERGGRACVVQGLALRRRAAARQVEGEEGEAVPSGGGACSAPRRSGGAQRGGGEGLGGAHRRPRCSAMYASDIGCCAGSAPCISAASAPGCARMSVRTSMERGPAGDTAWTCRGRVQGTRPGRVV